MKTLQSSRVERLISWFVLPVLISFPSASLMSGDPAPGAPQPQSSAQTEPSYQIQTKTNAVVVRVVVRDTKGKPVDGLAQSAFQLFDNGEPQRIAQFTVEHPATAKPVPPALTAEEPGER